MHSFGYAKGSSINDVKDLGKRGIKDFLMTVFTKDCVLKRVTMGEECQKLRDVIYKRPLRLFLLVKWSSLTKYPFIEILVVKVVLML